MVRVAQACLALTFSTRPKSLENSLPNNDLQEGDDDSDDEEGLTNGNVSRGGDLMKDEDEVSDPVNVSNNVNIQKFRTFINPPPQR